MNVAHIGNYKPESANGVNQTIAGLVSHLPSHGVSVELWHFTSKVTRVTERVTDAARVWDVPAFGNRLASAFLLPRAARDFLQERVKNVDALHLHSTFVPENAWTARVGAPYVLTPNGGYSPSVLDGRRRLAKRIWMRARERHVWQHSRVLHAVSPAEAAQLRHMAQEQVPVRFIPNGIGEELIGRVVDPPSGGSYLLYLGRLAVEHKGLDLLLGGYQRALRRHAALLPPLVLAGPDFRDGRRALEQRAATLGIEEQVTFLGAVSGEQKWTLLGGARCFMHPSRWEGMPFALLEAMALQRPVLVTPGTNLADRVREASCGIVVEPDEERIADGLIELCRAPETELDRFGTHARDEVRRRFVWPVIASQMAATYRELVT